MRGDGDGAASGVSRCQYLHFGTSKANKLVKQVKSLSILTSETRTGRALDGADSGVSICTLVPVKQVN